MTAETNPYMTRLNEALLRARSQTNHFASTSSATPDEKVFCDRCKLPLNRWQEPCKYERTPAALLAEDVIWLAKELALLENFDPVFAW
jgi:hypothetical protein